jgi:hypothetical protein
MNSQALAIQTDSKQAARLFDQMDISEGTRRDYQWRIGAFIQFLDDRPLSSDSYLEYKRYFERRRDLSVSTKNKYLMAARKWLRELRMSRGSWNFGTSRPGAPSCRRMAP